MDGHRKVPPNLHYDVGSQGCRSEKRPRPKSQGLDSGPHPQVHPTGSVPGHGRETPLSVGPGSVGGWRPGRIDVGRVGSVSLLLSFGRVPLHPVPVDLLDFPSVGPEGAVAPHRGEVSASRLSEVSRGECESGPACPSGCLVFVGSRVSVPLTPEGVRGGGVWAVGRGFYPPRSRRGRHLTRSRVRVLSLRGAPVRPGGAPSLVPAPSTWVSITVPVFTRRAPTPPVPFPNREGLHIRG